MKIPYYSFIAFLLVSPWVTFAASQVEVPTSIQVVDESGRTRVSTQTPERIPEQPVSLFVLPRECSAVFLGVPPLVFPVVIPESHPLRTRIQSQQEGLRSLVEQLSFGPELTRTQEITLKDRLSDYGIGRVSSSTTMDCLSLLETAHRLRDGADQRGTVGHLRDIATGLQYGLRALSQETHDVPTNAVEALYAGDIFRSQHNSITSLSITEAFVRMNVWIPVRMFWGRIATATVTISADERTVRMDTPWWMLFGTHTFSDTRVVLLSLPPQQPSVSGMYLRARDIVSALP